MLGKIKCGEKTNDGNPRSLDYFVADGLYKSYFDEAFADVGGKPTKIEIVFFSDDPYDSCRERFELRKGKKLYAAGDGKVFNIWDEKKEQYVEYNIAEHADFIKGLAASIGGKWETVLTLYFIIPRISGVFGCWTFTTRGKKSSIPEIRGTFDTVKNMFGRVAGVPMDFIVERVISQKPDSKAKYPVVKIVPNMSFKNLEKLKSIKNETAEFIGLLTDERINEIQMITMETGGDDDNT